MGHGATRIEMWAKDIKFAWVVGRLDFWVAWDLVQTFLEGAFREADRHLRRVGKVGSVEAQAARDLHKVAVARLK
jgi:hypothetical protein